MPLLRSGRLHRKLNSTGNGKRNSRPNTPQPTRLLFKEKIMSQKGESLLGYVLVAVIVLGVVLFLGVRLGVFDEGDLNFYPERQLL